MHRSKEKKKHKYTKEDEDVYFAVVWSIRLMALMHLLYFEKYKLFKTHA